MPLFYVDSSAVVKLVIDEPESQALRSFLQPGSLACARCPRVRSRLGAADPGADSSWRRSMTTTWNTQDLEQIEDADEMGIASRRADGSLRPYITIWFVRAGDDLYVRSAYGPENGWYQRALASGQGRVSVGDWEHDVYFEEPDPAIAEGLHQAYHAKYDRYPPTIVGTVVSDVAAGCTLRLVPR